MEPWLRRFVLRRPGAARALSSSGILIFSASTVSGIEDGDTTVAWLSLIALALWSVFSALCTITLALKDADQFERLREEGW